MSTKTEPTDDDSSEKTRYFVKLKPKYQHQSHRTEWVSSDSVEVRDGLVIFGSDEPDRIFDADEVLDVNPLSI